jgi:WD40 repeat protein
MDAPPPPPRAGRAVEKTSEAIIKMISLVKAREEKKHLALMTMHNRKLADKKHRSGSSKAAKLPPPPPSPGGRSPLSPNNTNHPSANGAPSLTIKRVPPPIPPVYATTDIYTEIEPVALYTSSSGSTFFDRAKRLVDRVEMRLTQHAHLMLAKGSGSKRLSVTRADFLHSTKWTKLMACMAKFSAEASEYDELLQMQKHHLYQKASANKPMSAKEKALYKELLDGSKTGWRIALNFAVAPPCLGSLTVTPSGIRAALSLILPSLNVLLSQEDACIWHKLTSGNGILIGHICLLGDSISIPSKLNPGQFKTYKCWGGGRSEVGLVRCRSAGFEKVLKYEEIPEKINYEYCKSIVSPPDGWNVGEVARSFKPPKASLDMKTVCGFRGDFISKNLYAVSEDGVDYVVYSVAALVVVQSLGAKSTQAHFHGHDDDVTCLAVEKGGTVRRAASGQMGKAGKAGKGENGACAMVWSVSSRKLLYKCGAGFFERQVQAVAFGGEKEAGGGARYLIAVGGDNNQTLAVFDLKAAALARQNKDSGDDVNAPMLCHGSMDKLPGALPTAFGLGWMNTGSDSIAFVSLSQGKSLKWWGADKAEGGTLTLAQKRKGGGIRDLREVCCMCWSGYDCKYLITGNDMMCSVAIWPGAGGEKPLQLLHLDHAWAGIWSVVCEKTDDANAMTVLCGCGDATIRRLHLKNEEGVGWSTGKVSDDHFLQETIVDPLSAEVKPGAKVSPHANEKSWAKVRHLDLVAGINTIVCGKEGGTLFHIKEFGAKGANAETAVAGGHAEHVNAVCAHPKWGDTKQDHSTYAFGTCGSDGLVCLWRETDDNDLPPLPAVRMRVGHEATGIAFSKDGSLMAVGCELGYVKIFGMSGGVGGGSRSASRVSDGKKSQGKAMSPRFGKADSPVVRGMEDAAESGKLSPSGAKEGRSKMTSAQKSMLKRSSPPTLVDHTSPGPVRASPASPGLVGSRATTPSRILKPVAARGSAMMSGSTIPVLLRQHKTLDEAVDCVRFSPTGEFLAAGSHDNHIDIFSMLKRGFPSVRRLRGHTSYITSVNWSIDGQCLQSTCGAGELLFFHADGKGGGKQITSTAQASTILMDGGRRTMDLHDWKNWERWSSTLGFPVMGIWPDFSDNTDVNEVSVSKRGRVIATADDFGGVKLLNFPCLVEDAPFVRYAGHASHVSGVQFLGEDRRVVSVGSNDRSCIVWRYAEAGSGDEGRGKEEDEEEDESLLPESQQGLIGSYRQHEEKEMEEKERRRLLDPFAYLREGGDSGGGRGEVKRELRSEMEVLSYYMGELLGAGVGGGGAGSVEQMIRRSVDMEKVLKGKGEEKGAVRREMERTELEELERKEREERSYGVGEAVGEEYAASDAELKACGLLEVEEANRKTIRAVMKRRMEVMKLKGQGGGEKGMRK